MRVLITGINGFVGPYLKAELEAQEDSGYEVYGLDLSGDEKKVFSCDITQPEKVVEVLGKTMPELIFHLAGFSSVAKSFEAADLCTKINVGGTKNLLEACLKLKLRPKILIVSSAEVYGEPKYIPIDEKHPLNPLTPYGKSRLEQEKLALGFKLPIIISRLFNHTGPGQSESMFIPSIKKQIREAKEGGTIFAGNIHIIRDFSDVRDIVKAYRIILEKGEVAEYYNLGSGVGYSLEEIIQKLIRQSGKKLKIAIDPKRVRSNDILKLVCDTRKIQSLGIEIRDIFSFEAASKTI